MRKYFDSLKLCETSYANMPLDSVNQNYISSPPPPQINLLSRSAGHHNGNNGAMMRAALHHHNTPGNPNTFSQHPSNHFNLMSQLAGAFSPHDLGVGGHHIGNGHGDSHHSIMKQRHQQHGIHTRSHSQHYCHTNYHHNQAVDYPSSNNYYNLSNAGHRSKPPGSQHNNASSRHPTPTHHLHQTSNNTNTNCNITAINQTNETMNHLSHQNLHQAPTQQLHQQHPPPASVSLHQLNQHHIFPGAHSSPSIHQQHHHNNTATSRHHTHQQQHAAQPPHLPHKVDMIAVMQVCTELGYLDTQPPTPSARNYTVSSTRDGRLFKVNYPQRRILKSPFTDRSTGLCLPRGSPLFVKGPSKEDRSKLSAYYNEHQLDIPFVQTHLPQPSVAPTLAAWAQ